MSFANDIKKFAEKANTTTEKTVQAFCIQLSSNIIESTPVRDGGARNNWFPTIGQPSTEKTTQLHKSGADRIRDLRKIKSRMPGNVFYLTNNLPYIRRLEYEGYSRQAPDGMVRVNIRRARQALRNAVREAQT